MKFICSKADLENAIKIVSKAIPNKTTMSILECILIDATGEKITLIANDMELGIETIMEGEILEKGVFAVANPSYFQSVVSNFIDEKLTLETLTNKDKNNDYSIRISGKKRVTTCNGKSGEDFSYLPQIEKNDPVLMSQYSLRDVIKCTSFSVSSGDTNKIMSGELFEIKEDNLRVVSLDGHRVSIRNVKLKESYEHKKVIIPGKTLGVISDIISSSTEKNVKIYFTDKHALFEFDNTVVISRLIEGEYLKIDQMLSSDYETKITINKKEFSNSISSAALSVKGGDKKPVILTITDGNMNVKLVSVLGSMNEDIDIEKSGKDIMIAFNPNFLIDALKVIEDETIDIYLMNSKAPCFIRDAAENYIYLILPVQFTVVQ